MLSVVKFRMSLQAGTPSIPKLVDLTFFTHWMYDLSRTYMVMMPLLPHLTINHANECATQTR